jgi:hypothetical protein
MPKEERQRRAAGAGVEGQPPVPTENLRQKVQPEAVVAARERDQIRPKVQ